MTKRSIGKETASAYDPVLSSDNPGAGAQIQSRLGTMDVAAWLETLGLAEYGRQFSENHVDFSVLTQLTEADLKELGVTSLGHRKRLLAAIAVHNAVAAAVPEHTAPLGERRQVTILFADLSGFTALSQSLDPEELLTLVGRFTRLVDGIIIACGGTVDKHIGDAVMALFGAPRAHDDDPLRAARAALDIHEGLATLSEGIGRRMQAHVGIASGEVVAGAFGQGDIRSYTVLGDSVNLAARLVATATPGQTLISGTVHRDLSGRGVCEPLGEMAFKGIDAPVRVWRLLDIAGEATIASRGPFIGRQAELEQYKSILAACLDRRIGQAIYVRGEAGIGKTRLVEEMRCMAKAQGFTVHRALMLDFGMGKGQDPIRAILRSMLDIPASADASERQTVAQRVAASGAIATEQSMFLYDLLDLPQARQWRALYEAMDNAARNRGKRALVAAFTQEACRRGPTVIVVEDLHWADPQVLDHLGAITAALLRGPGLLVMTSRIEGDPLDAAWRANCRGTPFATIDLGPLHRDEALSLAGNFTDATRSLALACVERAGGNPLFLEQLLRNAEEGRGDSVPASIQSLVLARMDRLSPIDRLAFQSASIIGQRFELPLLRRLLGVSDYACHGLVVHALVLPEGEGFLFAHALIQEGAYTSLLKARRRELHAVAAAWFAGHDPALHAQHLDRADAAEAPRAYRDAAAAQRAAHHADVALRLAQRGLKIARNDTDRHELTCLVGELLQDLGDTTASIATFRQAVAAAPDAVALCRAQLGLAEGLRVSEGLAEAFELINAAQTSAERHDLVPELARIHHLRGNILFPMGNIEGCREEHELGLAYARRSGSPEAEARALGGLADAAYAQGRMRTAFTRFSRCVALSREHGYGRIEVANRSMVGFSRVYLNEPRAALEDGRAAARAAALVSQPRAEMLGETMCVFASYELGELETMMVFLERTLKLTHQLGARRFEVQCLEMNARRLLDMGCRAEAVAILREAVAIGREVGMQFSGPRTLGALARAVEDRAECGRLLAEGEELLARGAVGHNHLWFYRDSIEAMLVLGDSGAALRYVEALEHYTRDELLPWSNAFIARGRALAAALHGPLDAALRHDLAGVRATLVAAELNAFLPPIERLLAA
jgi:class 3 adenylate cyclase/tetratricopeptide (TPR) repeat protein